MTRDKQVALIKGSVAGWNEWRTKNRSIRAYLQSADLRCADLRGAYLQSADLQSDIKIEVMTGRVYRSDDYLFMGFATNAGLMIKAGCRVLSPDEYREHVAKEYPATPKAKETLRIIQYIEDCAKEQEQWL